MSFFARRNLLVALLASWTAAATAQPTLVADLAPTAPDRDPVPGEGLSPVYGLHGFGQAAVFLVGGDPDVWRTDGTAEGTSMLFHVCPDVCDGVEPLAAVGGHLFLHADLAGWPVERPFDSGPAPTSLMRTDGTVEGTVVLLPDLFYDLEWLGNAGEIAVFSYHRASPLYDEGLLAADLESDAPVMMLPIETRIRGGAASGGRLFVGTDDGVWVTDGSLAGSRRIDEKGCSAPQVVAAGVVCWDEEGVLSVTNGGPLQALAPARPPAPRSAAADGTGRVFYVLRAEGGDELWVTDGTPGGTRRIAAPSDLGEIGAHEGHAYFAAYDPLGVEPWISDGTPLGTRRLADLCPGWCSSNPRQFVPHAGGMLLAAEPATVEGTSLWHLRPAGGSPRRLLDGLSSFTGDELTRFVLHHQEDVYLRTSRVLQRIDRDLTVHEIGPTDSFFFLRSMASVGPWVLFSRDGVLWRTDGTPGGTSELLAIEASGPGIDPRSFVEHAGRLCFVAFEVPWCTSPDGVEELPWPEGEVASRLVTAGGELFVQGTGLFVYRDLAAVPVPLPAPRWGHPADVGGTLFLLVEGFMTEPDDDFLWRTDGTPEGTWEVANVAEEVDRRGVDPIVLGARLLFVTLEGILDGTVESLWSSDGTAEGTFVLHEEGLRHVIFPVRFRDAVWFTGAGKLWRTDGTPAGTQPVFSLSQFKVGGRPALFAFADRLLIWGELTDGSGQLLSTDGVTPPEELELPAGGVASLRDGARLGDRVVHQVWAGDGRPLWVTDGTAAGSQKIELPPGSRPADFHGPVAVDGYAMFIGTDLAHGSELWLTDGTSEGTRRVFDLAPGPASSMPRHMIRVGDLLYFVADDGRTGRELWSMPWSQVVSGGTCAPSATRLCLGGGRFAVDARWRDPYNGGEGVGHAVTLPGSDQSGVFWFFDPGNVELIVKALDGTPVNGHHWLFYGALTTVEYWIDVTDTVTGATRSYHNPPGEQCGRGDTAAFEGSRAGATSAGIGASRTAAAPAAAGCGAPGTLCLLGGSLAVEVDWHDPRSGDRGAGVPIPGTDNSGYFWFFDDQNVELVVKALDGTTVNGHRWFFYGGLSDVEYEIRVTETASGDERVYRNPFGEICGGSDTTAF